MKRTRFIALLAIVVVVFSFSTATAGWYMAKIKTITPRTATGDVFVQLTSADDPPLWTGLARGVIVGSEDGAKTILATMLTAFSLDYAVSIQMDNTPEWTNAQVIDSCGVTAP
jgi:hypothetical protein